MSAAANTPSKEERAWWMALALSEARLSRAKGDEIYVHHTANCAIRNELVKRFGQNLDDLSADGEDLLFKAMREAAAKESMQQSADNELAHYLDAFKKRS